MGRQHPASFGGVSDKLTSREQPQIIALGRGFTVVYTGTVQSCQSLPGLPCGSTALGEPRRERSPVFCGRGLGESATRRFISMSSRLILQTLTSSQPSSLICRDLHVRFSGGPDVLRGIDCEFRAGEITSLVGPSGCGKTTLLRVLAGLQQLGGGLIDIDPPAKATRGEIAFVFQQPTLLPWRTAIDNVMLAIQLSRAKDSRDQLSRDQLSWAEATELAEHELEMMELPRDAFRRFPRELSGGMKMRVSLARALVTRPTVLLMDEPFAALDDLSRTALGDLLLRRWDERPFTGVLVTHNIAEAALLSHRVFVLNAGRIGEPIVDDLPRPRDESVKTSAAFGQLYATISAALRSDPSQPQH